MEQKEAMMSKVYVRLATDHLGDRIYVTWVGRVGDMLWTFGQCSI